MSPHHALPSLVMLPSPQLVSSVGQGLCWLCMHLPHEDGVGLEWFMGMAPPVRFLDFVSLLVTSPHHALPSLVVLPSPQGVSSVGQGLCWLCGTGRMKTLWVWSGAWECPPLFSS